MDDESRGKAKAIVARYREQYKGIKDIRFVTEKTYDASYSDYDHKDYVVFERPFKLKKVGIGDNVSYIVTTDGLLRREKVATPQENYSATRFETDDSQVNLVELYMLQNRRQWSLTSENETIDDTETYVMESPKLKVWMAKEPLRILKVQEFCARGRLRREYNNFEYQNTQYSYENNDGLTENGKLAFPTSYSMRVLQWDLNISVSVNNVSINKGTDDQSFSFTMDIDPAETRDSDEKPSE